MGRETAPIQLLDIMGKLMKYIIKAKSVGTSTGIHAQGTVVDLPEAEVTKIHKMKPGTFEAVEDTVVFKSTAKKAPAKKAPAQKKKRARNANGTLKADDPSTPNVNEAYE
tara:strand:+ start:1669 stop:1998 length:330 start_codon:yes stop_codon:yes gene_type:complete